MRAQEPLIGHFITSNMEQKFSILSELLTFDPLRFKQLFSSHYTLFFCLQTDPTYLKKLKLEVLAKLANSANYSVISKHVLYTSLSYFCFESLHLC